MTPQEHEILNRAGRKLLSIIQKDFPNGFQIVGSDQERFVVGDQSKNSAYSRNKVRRLETVTFNTTRKLSRKGY